MLQHSRGREGARCIFNTIIITQRFHAYRVADAEKVYLHGIKRRARPAERLNKRYTEFRARASAKAPAPPRAPPSSAPLPPSSAWRDASAEAKALRREPLKNFRSSSSSSVPAPAAATPASEQASSSTTESPEVLNHPAMTKHGHTRYQPMLMPPQPGKRPERYRFNLSMLFTDDGIEYSVEEARARSMGLLGKKWAPPPPSEMRRLASSTSSSLGSSSSSTSSDQPKTSMRRRGYDESERTVQGRGYVGGYTEPTVTLATKEALADVFGMYNSPEKTMRNGPAAGSKYAPVRRVEPITPAGGSTLQSALRQAKADENAKTPMQVFRDENAGIGARNAKENAVTPGAGKVNIFKYQDICVLTGLYISSRFSSTLRLQRKRRTLHANNGVLLQPKTLRHPQRRRTRTATPVCGHARSLHHWAISSKTREINRRLRL